MEHLWSQADASGGNRWQMRRARKRLKQAETVAVGCDQLPRGPDGKEGVDGSSPLEGSRRSPGNPGFFRRRGFANRAICGGCGAVVEQSDEKRLDFVVL